MPYADVPKKMRKTKTPKDSGVQEQLKYCEKVLKDLHKKCTKEMDEYVGCMYYYTNEFEMCRKEQQAFEKACPLE